MGRRLAWLRLALAAGLVAGLLLSPNLWVSSTRAYPLTPVWDLVLPLPYPYDYALFGLFVALAASLGIVRGRALGWLAGVFLVVAMFLVLGDVSRLQPWLYQYSFMLMALCLYGSGRVDALSALNACRLIIVATYFWSGLQKANAGFFEAYPWLVGPLTEWVPAWADSALLSGAYAVPIVEAAIGVGLLTRRFRKLAVGGAVLMHVFIMVCIGPWGNDHNAVVWPWNFAMVAFVLILFWRAPDEPSPRSILIPGWNFFSPGFVLRAAVLVLFAFMPLFSFFGLWDSYLSSSLYSGASKRAYVMEWDGSEWQTTRIGDLAERELNAPAYPEVRVFKSVFAQRWCESQADYQGAVLRVDGRPAILSGERSSEFYGCDDVSRA